MTFSLSRRYPGLGVVLDCIDSRSLPSFFLLFESMDKHIPKKTVKGKVDVPWMTDKVKDWLRKKDDYT